MLWLVRNVLSSMILPPCGLLLMQVVGLFLWKMRPRLAGMLVTFSLVGLFVTSIPAVTGRLLAEVERQATPLDLSDAELASRADAIVVLGAGRTYANPAFGGRDTVSNPGLLRLRYAADLYRKTFKPVLLTGGSPDRPGASEARLMAEALKSEFGVEARWLEEKAINTAENAAFSREILKKHGIDRVFVVTTAWHMPRARRAFEAAGFKVVEAPMDYMAYPWADSSVLGWIPSAKGVDYGHLGLHEEVGSLWYRLQGEN